MNIPTVSHRQILDASLICLRCIGLWYPPANSSTIYRIFHAVYNKLVIVLLCTFAGTLLADLFLGYNDLTIVTDDGCFLAGISVIVFKIFNFQIRHNKIQQLIDAVHDPVDVLQYSTDGSVLSLIKSFVFWEKTTVYSLIPVAVFLMIAMIFFVPTENGSLPIRAKYPFDTTIQPMHSVAFAIQVCVIIAGVTAILAIDMVVIGFCRFTTLQLKILSSNYRNCQSWMSPRSSSLKLPIGNLSTTFLTNDENCDIRCFVPFNPEEVHEVNDCFLKRFKTCVKHHQRLITIVDDINELFSSSMLMQLFASFSMICLAGFQAVLGAKERANLMKFAIYLGSAFIQLLCWCWFGNKLIYQSDSLAISQWFSGWENETDLSAASTLIIVSLVRTRRAMELTAGKFYTMSMETFIVILRGSYSFFALLTSVTDRE